MKDSNLIDIFNDFKSGKIDKSTAIEYFFQKYLKDGVHPEDALNLAKLAIIGWALSNLENDELYKEDPEWYKLGDVDVWDYKLDKMGRVIEIYIKPWEGRSRLMYFPQELCYFMHLEILDIWFNELEIIPDTIMNLKSMKNLSMANFGKKLTKITKSVKLFLESLDSFYFDGKISS
ncbi:MAG: hypothetical protein ACFFD2_26220 [Promethearchaeota archaeon]